MATKKKQSSEKSLADKPLPSLFKWPGGKNRMSIRLVKELEKLHPNHDTYVEPFAGGASVFFRKKPVKRNVLSDVDKELIELYQQVRKGGLRKCSGGIKQSRSLFKRAQKRRDACHRLAKITLSFHGIRGRYRTDTGNGKVILAKKLKNLDAYEAKLKKATLSVNDFFKTMKKYDSTKTLHFIDPPWSGQATDYSEQFYQGGKKALIGKNRKTRTCAFDPGCVAKRVSTLKGAVLGIYEDSKQSRAAFCSPSMKKKGWVCKRVMASTSSTGYGNVKRPNLIAMKKAKRS